MPEADRPEWIGRLRTGRAQGEKLRAESDVVRLLLEAGAKVEPADLFQAWRGSEDRTQQLLQVGAKVNVLTQDGESPLHFAAGSGNPPMVEMLIAVVRGPPVILCNG